MLPDFRVVTIAVISTFLFAVSVGFYTSSRLMSERKPRTDSLAMIEDHPLNRIALNWPEPVQPPSESFNLDFAVTAKVQRNPVREVSDESTSVRPKVAAAPQEAIGSTRADQPVIDAPKVETVNIEPSKIEPSKIETPKIEVPKLALPQVAISKVASAKIDPAVIEGVAPPPLAIAPRAKSEDNLATASIVQAAAPNPNSEDPKSQPETAVAPPAANIATLPEAAETEADAKLEIVTKPEVESAEAKPAKKKARKAKKRPAKTAVKPAPRPRLRPRPTVTTASNPFGFPFAGFQNQGFQTR